MQSAQTNLGYVFGPKIGKGGFGEVYNCFRIKDGLKFAVKKILGFV